jgi:hypothetical protein
MTCPWHGGEILFHNARSFLGSVIRDRRGMAACEEIYITNPICSVQPVSMSRLVTSKMPQHPMP